MRSRFCLAQILPAAALLAGLQACSSSSESGGTGGKNVNTTGGAPGSGGALGSSSGGITGTGGTPSVSTGGQVGASTGGTPGNPTGTGGTLSSTGGGSTPATGGAAAGGRGTGGAPGVGGGTVPSGLSIQAAWPYGAIMTGVRGVATPAVTETVKVHNGGATPVMVTALTLDGANKGAFQLMGMPALPATLAAGADLSVTIQTMTSGAAIGAEPPQNDGGTVLTATLTATAGSATAQLNVFGVLQSTLTHEVTLGQILTVLGYKLNVGKAQNNANPNTGSSPSTLPKVEANTDEIATSLFKKGPAGDNVTLRAVARFSPKGPMPYGWYPMGSPNMRNMVNTMASMPDGQTSDKARMVVPPLSMPTSTFNPAAATFGIWVYSDQLSQKYDTGGTATNGDYNYSEDAPNSPANTHRTKVYPLKDAAGTVVPNSYLLAVEEAGNGDYQDYVFVLENATPAN